MDKTQQIGCEAENPNSPANKVLLADSDDSPVEIEEPDCIEEEGLRYKLTEIPPIPVTLFVALQHVLISLAAALTVSAVISDLLCAEASHPIRARLFSTTLAMSGVSTIIQTLLGVRLPVFQGPSSSFLVPLVGLSAMPSWQCADHSPNTTLFRNDSELVNVTSGLLPDRGYSMEEKLQQLSGSLMIAALVEVLMGGLGFIRPLMRLIGPLTVAPTIGLIGLSLFRLPVVYAKFNPAIALASAVLVIIFSLYMAEVRVPGCTRGGKRQGFQVFQVFPILLAMVVMWALCAILTVAGVFPDDKDSLFYLSRTDAKINIVKNTPWFNVPYPGQFGPPSISIPAIIGFAAASVSSLVESVGDYFAAAKCCQVMSPPDHAISRGILIEGIGSFLSGAVGAAHATTSYSGNIAMLRLTRTASRAVLVLAGGIIVALSLVGKVGAILATLPPPVLGGILIVMLGLLASLGMSTLTYADMSSNRNLLITGIAFIAGLSVPEFVEKHGDMLGTGNSNVDQVIHIVLGTPMFLGGLLGLFLDNTVPGTDEERGLTTWRDTNFPTSAGNDVTKKDDSRDTHAARSKLESALERRKSSHRHSILEISLLSEEDVYWFKFLKGRLRSRLWGYIPFFPHSTQPQNEIM